MFCMVTRSVGELINDSDVLFSLKNSNNTLKTLTFLLDKSIMVAAVPLVSDTKETLLDDEREAVLLFAAKRNNW